MQSQTEARRPHMCLAIPGQIVAVVDETNRLAKVDETEALETRRMLESMGEDYENELEELKASIIE